MTDKPAYVLLGNGKVALRHLERAVREGHTPEIVVLNTPEKQRDGAALREVASDAGTEIVVWGRATAERLRRLAQGRSDLWLLSVYFGHLLDAALLRAFGGQAVNLHPSLLPWNRGAHTNVWPIVEGTPGGVTLHAMVPEVDAGPVLAQREVQVRAVDTGASLYSRLEEAAERLLAEAWPEEILAKWPGDPQVGSGTSHRVGDLHKLQEVDITGDGEGRRLFDLLRARTFPPHPGLRVRIGNEVVEARIELAPVEEEEGNARS